MYSNIFLLFFFNRKISIDKICFLFSMGFLTTTQIFVNMQDFRVREKSWLGLISLQMRSEKWENLKFFQL